MSPIIELRFLMNSPMLETLHPLRPSITGVIDILVLLVKLFPKGSGFVKTARPDRRPVPTDQHCFDFAPHRIRKQGSSTERIHEQRVQPGGGVVCFTRWSCSVVGTSAVFVPSFRSNVWLLRWEESDHSETRPSAERAERDAM